MAKPTILLIASQMPQQELGLIAQLLQSQGYRQQAPSDRPKNAAVLIFETADKSNSVAIKFYQEIGALRLELVGETSKKIGVALGQYMEPLTPERIAEFYDMSQSDMERRIYAILLVLTYPDGVTAMNEMRQKYFVEAKDATKEGVVQGLAFLETPDVGIPLEEIEKACKGQEIAVMARRAIDGLCERGLIRESLSSFMNKVEKIIDAKPDEALALIEKYEADGEVPEIRALHAKSLRLLGRMDDASSLVAQIDIDAPDACEAFCERALIREAGGFAAQAMNDAQMALACKPSCELATEIFQRLSIVLEHASSSAEDKLSQYSRALEANPDDVNMRCQRAECLIGMGKPEEAIEDLKAAQKLAPNDLRLPQMLAEAYLAIRHLGCALDQASKAQKIHVASQENAAWLLKPRVFLAMNLPEKALTAIHEIPAEIRDADEVEICTGIVEEMLGNADSARAHYAAVPDGMARIFNAMNICIYRDLPILREVSGISSLMVREAPASPLGDEPVDPFFKRCDACGALTMQRRTFCRECSNGSFF